MVELSHQEKELLKFLIDKRSKISDDNNIQPFTIISDTDLLNIVRSQPSRASASKAGGGIGDRVADEYKQEMFRDLDKEWEKITKRRTPSSQKQKRKVDDSHRRAEWTEKKQGEMKEANKRRKDLVHVIKVVKEKLIGKGLSKRQAEVAISTYNMIHADDPKKRDISTLSDADIKDIAQKVLNRERKKKKKNKKKKKPRRAPGLSISGGGAGGVGQRWGNPF